jgi:hypothetical protein
MAQVDRDLSTVDFFDRLLGLIKNLGRHSWSERGRGERKGISFYFRIYFREKKKM